MRGFTLLELLITGCIILVLAAVFGPRFFSQRHPGGQITACKSNLKNIGTMVDMYMTDHGRAPERLSQLTPIYLKTVPTCPKARRDTYSASFVSVHRRKGSDYTVTCTGLNHADVGLKAPNFPQYTGTTGLIERP